MNSFLGIKPKKKREFWMHQSERSVYSEFLIHSNSKISVQILQVRDDLT